MNIEDIAEDCHEQLGKPSPWYFPRQQHERKEKREGQGREGGSYRCTFGPPGPVRPKPEKARIV
jgi:hypothetical protein